MKSYTNKNPAFADSIDIIETTDANHADNVNVATKQLLDNTLYLKNQQEKNKTVVDDELNEKSTNPIKNAAVATELRKLTEEIAEIKKLLPPTPPTTEDAGKVLKINADGQVTWAEDYGASWQARHPDFAHGSDTYSSSGNSHFETTYDNGDRTVTDRADDGTITEELYVDGVKVAEKVTTSEITDDGKHIVERMVDLDGGDGSDAAG